MSLDPELVKAALRAITCAVCGGFGEITRDVVVNGTDHDTETTPCSACNGTGKAEGFDSPGGGGNF